MEKDPRDYATFTPVEFQYEAVDEDGDIVLMEGITKDVFPPLTVEGLEIVAADLCKIIGITQVVIQQIEYLKIN